MDFRVKPFEVSPYNAGTCIIKNPLSARYEVVSEYQAALVAQLEAGGTPVSVLFPAVGVATSRHFEQCIGLFRTLAKLDLIETGAVGEETTKGTGTIGRDLFLEVSALKFLQPAAEAIVETVATALAKLRVPGLFALTLTAVAGAILLLPPSGAGAFLDSGTSYLSTILLLYAGISVALSARELVRAAFLRALQRSALDVRFGLFGPFLTLCVDARDVWMSGHSARMQLALLGLLSPLLPGLVACGLHSLGLASDGFALLACGASFAAAMLVAFPLVSADGEEMLHLAMFGRKLERRLASETRAAVIALGAPEVMRRRVIWTLVATFAWSLLWLDFTRTALGFYVPLLARDLSGKGELVTLLGAFATAGVAALGLLFPFLFLAALLAYGAYLKVRGRKTKLVPDIEVTWEEKERLIGRIPLFALLGEATRLQLLEEMENHSYEPGQPLVVQGDKGAELFILVRGEAQAEFRDASGRTHVVGILREGDAFGEIALIDDVPRTASIVARTRCYALTLSKEDFQAHIMSQVADPDRVKQMIRLSSFFKRHPLLSRMKAKTQAAVIEKFRFRTVMANEDVIGRESADSRFFLVYTGRLSVTGEQREDEFTLASEDCFGYLLPGQNPAFRPRVKAKEGCGLLTLSQEDFRSLILDKVSTDAEILKC